MLTQVDARVTSVRIEHLLSISANGFKNNCVNQNENKQVCQNYSVGQTGSGSGHHFRVIVVEFPKENTEDKFQNPKSNVKQMKTCNSENPDLVFTQLLRLLLRQL